jgi:hypothetical protein
MSPNYSVRMLVTTVCLVTFTVMASCKPSSVQLTGIVTVKFLKLTGSQPRFDLENGTSKSIELLAYRRSEHEVDPIDSFITCELPAGMSRYPHVMDIPGSEEERFEVSTGRRIELWPSISVGLESKGAQCTLSLKLTDGTTIDSPHFVP